MFWRVRQSFLSVCGPPLSCIRKPEPEQRMGSGGKGSVLGTSEIGILFLQEFLVERAQGLLCPLLVLGIDALGLELGLELSNLALCILVHLKRCWGHDFNLVGMTFPSFSCSEAPGK